MAGKSYKHNFSLIFTFKMTKRIFCLIQLLSHRINLFEMFFQHVIKSHPFELITSVVFEGKFRG